MRRRAIRWSVWSLSLAGVLYGAGCVIEEPPKIPTTRQEYDALQSSQDRAYPRQSVIGHNLVRAADADVPLEGRRASLELIESLGGGSPRELSELAQTLRDQKAPPELQAQVASIQSKRGLPTVPGPRPGPGPAVASPGPSTIPVPVAGPASSDQTVAWLEQAKASDLAEVVKRWARLAGPTDRYEEDYRKALSRLSGQRWDQGLLWAINAPEFFARGSALHVLNARVSRQRLGKLIDDVTPRTSAMHALKEFHQRVGYVPRDTPSFVAITLLYTTAPDMIAPAGRLSDKWNTDHGYEFRLQDFHLLSRLAGEPLHKSLRRGELILSLGRTMLRRNHVPAQAVRGSQASDRFNEQVEKLSLPDLWNLYLLNTMLSDERMQTALAVMAARDREDRQRAWGGLVFYNSGRIEPKLYDASMKAGANDELYIPSARCLEDGRNALCRFHGHFNRLANAKNAGPSASEMDQARQDNIYGLVLTSLDDASFCAHYYTPGGVVVSLGVFPFPKGK